MAGNPRRAPDRSECAPATRRRRVWSQTIAALSCGTSHWDRGRVEHIGEDLPVGRTAGEIDQFVGIVLEVEQQGRIVPAEEELEAAVPQHEGRLEHAFGQIFARDDPLRQGPVFEKRQQEGAVGLDRRLRRPPSSPNVGRMSSSDTGSGTLCGTKRPGAQKTSGTRTAHSKKHFL